MADFSRRAMAGLQGLVQGDIEEAFTRVRKDLDSAGNYTAAVAADWSGSPPATIAEALDRLAAALGPIAA